MIRALALSLALTAPAGAVETLNGELAVLRGLDKISGEVGDIEIPAGGTASYGRLDIEVKECRYPRANPSGDSFAFVTIRPQGGGEPFFQGWMIASSPALNAFDNQRYDVWLLRCHNS